MNNSVRRNAALLMRWVLLISLAARCQAQCAFSDYPSDATEIKMNYCDLISINTTELERFTTLQNLYLRGNNFRTFPDLSPIASLLKTLRLDSNLITSINPTLLEGFTNLQELGLSGNDLKTIPDLSPISSTLTMLRLSSNQITSINLTFLVGVTNLQVLYMGYTDLMTFPDLSPIAGKLKALGLDGNKFTSINTTLLEGFTTLQSLYLKRNNLSTFPDLLPIASTLKILGLDENKLTSINTTELEGFTNLQVLYLNNNNLTTFPDLSPIASRLRMIGLNFNNISAISKDALLSLVNLEKLKLTDNINLKHFPHTANALKNIKELDIHNTGISHLPPILFDNITTVKILDISNSVEVCQCENAWLKQEGPKIASFRYDDADCGDQQWSSMTMDGFDMKCEGERNLKEKNFARAISVKSKMSLKAFLLHSHKVCPSEIECTRKCLRITGCVSFYWRLLHDRLGDCVIIAPGNSISVESVPDGNLEVWTYFAVQ